MIIRNNTLISYKGCILFNHHHNLLSDLFKVKEAGSGSPISSKNGGRGQLNSEDNFRHSFVRRFRLKMRGNKVRSLPLLLGILALVGVTKGKTDWKLTRIRFFPFQPNISIRRNDQGSIFLYEIDMIMMIINDYK